MDGDPHEILEEGSHSHLVIRESEALSGASSEKEIPGPAVTEETVSMVTGETTLAEIEEAISVGTEETDSGLEALEAVSDLSVARTVLVLTGGRAA